MVVKGKAGVQGCLGKGAEGSGATRLVGLGRGGW